jgi:hypothetical protein
MKYFENFPRLIYTFDKNVENQQFVVDILARSAFLREVANNTNIAYEYQIQDSDTPEVIAHKIYGDPYRNWIILLYNQIVNPFYDWPMKNDVLDSFVVNKYNMTIDQSKSTIHHYEKEIREVASYNGTTLEENVKTYTISQYDYNQNTSSLVENTLPTIADTSLVISTETYNYTTYILTVTTTHKAVSNYTYEFNENEKRRTIRLLQDFYVTRVEDEFKEIMRNG